MTRRSKAAVGSLITLLVLASFVGVASAAWQRSFSSTSTVIDEQICETGIVLTSETTMNEDDANSAFPGGVFVGATRVITETLFADAGFATPLVDVEVTETIVGQEGGAGSNYVLEGIGSAPLPPGYANGDIIYARNLNTGTFVFEPLPLIVGDPIYECEPDVEPEGCRPGFWRWHWGAWEDYHQFQRFSHVFDNGPRRTLLGVLWTPGGKFRSLNRHAVAGLLNAANDGVNYPYSEAEVIDLVDNAYSSGDWRSARNALRHANKLGCPL